MIPDLLRAAPQVRPVLDRYGLRGCGGPEGPAESLEFFAQAHEVPLPALLDELRASAGQPAVRSLPVLEPKPEPADMIYRPFFKAGIVVTLTLGAVWGAYLLLRIALGGTFAAVGVHEVNAHGHAQIFGWVGLFVMGFAYQAFPRFKHAPLAHPRLAFATFWLMLAGVVGRSVAEPLASPDGWLADLAVAAAWLEVAAVALFAWVIAATWRRSGKPLAFYDYYIASALGWFVIQAVCEAVYLRATLAVAGGRELIDLVATWQGSLRDIQIHGFALLMILGVSQRLFHHFYGLRAPNPRLSLGALVCLNAAVAGEAVSLVFLRGGHGVWVVTWYVSVLVLTGAVTALVADWRIFAPCPEGDRSLKFLRAAYVWLLVSLGMLTLLPAYQRGLLPWLAPDSRAVRIGFSHAYSGAVRHAITVGFVSLMIVGVAAKVVPTLSGVDVRRLRSLWLPFLLINGGCALRVIAQTCTDFREGAYPVAGASGCLEVLGLALWGAHLWSVMTGRARLRPDGAEAAAPPPDPGSPITARDHVGAVLDRHPELLGVFVSFGFTPLTNPVLRHTLGRRVTIEAACRHLGVDTEQLLEALNRPRMQSTVTRHPLPLVSA
jgi:hypothetical protein